jgi:hypothetical protein
MGSRGPKSSVDIAIAGVNKVDRPGPVPGMTDEQKIEWMQIINDSPADRFDREQLPLLECYCRHRVALRHVGELVRVCEDGELRQEEDKRLCITTR